MKRSFTITITIAAALISFLFAANAFPDETEAEKAKKHFIQGVALYNESNFEAALIEFAASYKYKKNWKVKYYIGIAYQALHRFVEAEKELKAYLEEGGSEIPKEKKAKAEEVLSQVAGVIGSVMIEANVEGALITMDGKSVGKTPLAGPLSLNVGHYEVEVNKKGYETYTTEIDLPGGEELTIEVELKKKDAAAAVKDDEEEEEEEQPLPDAVKDTKGKKKTVKPAAFYGMVGATGALLIGTVVCSVMAMQKHNEFDDTDTDSVENIEKREDLKSSGETLNVVSDVLVGVTAAAAAATIVLAIFTDFSKKEKKTSSAPKVQFGGTSISLIHHF
ncbi:MAG: PEGA domain-containing protein [Pseudomonadota bacterium]